MFLQEEISGFPNASKYDRTVIYNFQKKFRDTLKERRNGMMISRWPFVLSRRKKQTIRVILHCAHISDVHVTTRNTLEIQ